MSGARSTTEFEKYLEHVRGSILDLEVEMLPESKYFNAASANIGLEG